jgi:DNA-binding transcriptional LysR family regulator
MGIHEWSIILALYECKNITKAAKKLYISQPALTSRIKQIEADFDTTIVIRHKKGVLFTPEGEYLAAKAKEMIKQHDSIIAHLNNMKETVTGSLKIGVSKYLAKHLLPKILRLFKSTFSNVEFQVFTGLSEDIYKLISEREIHIAFIRGDYPWRDEKYLLFEESLSVAYSKPFNLDDLPHLPRITYYTNQQLTNTFDEWWMDHYDVPSKASIQVDQVDSSIEMIKNGLGYGIIPSTIIENTPNIYKKTLKDKAGTPLKRNTWMYCHGDLKKINMTREFVEYIKKYFGG